MKYRTFNIEEKEILKDDLPRNTIDQTLFKEFKLQGNNDMQLYNLKIYQGKNSILFQIKNAKDLNDTIYKKEVSLEDFYNLNINFRKFKTCKQLFEDSFGNFPNENILIYNENNIIRLIFIFKEKLKDEPITIILKPEKEKEDIILWNLYERVSKLEQQNRINKTKLGQFEEIIKNKKDKDFFSLLFKNKISLFIFVLCIFAQIIFLKKNSQDKIIKELKNEISEIKKYYLVNKRNSFNLYSGLIKKDEIELIEKEIIENLNKRVINFKLLYRASRDGFEAQNFHKKCDGHINTLTLVKTVSQIRFGGFTENYWDDNSRNKDGKKGFVFSLNDKKIFYNDNGEYNIYCDKKVGPSFIGGKHDFTIVDKCNCDGEISIENKFYAQVKDKYYEIKDYEVYEIILE